MDFISMSWNIQFSNCWKESCCLSWLNPFRCTPFLFFSLRILPWDSRTQLLVASSCCDVILGMFSCWNSNITCDGPYTWKGLSLQHECFVRRNNLNSVTWQRHLTLSRCTLSHVRFEFWQLNILTMMSQWRLAIKSYRILEFHDRVLRNLSTDCTPEKVNSFAHLWI